jgi:hypothetical protein
MRNSPLNEMRSENADVSRQSLRPLWREWIGEIRQNLCPLLGLPSGDQNGRECGKTGAMKPIATFLAYSAGEQSQAIIEMILRGEMERPDPFIVLNADPGMEDQRSYDFVLRTRARCLAAGIQFFTVRAPGETLLEGLLSLPNGQKTRFDHPPYFTKGDDGKRGQLKQKCTGYFKIEPMKRQIRIWLRDNLGIPINRKRGLPQVESWIGFAFDEQHRLTGKNGKKKNNNRQPKYIRLRYPLIEMEQTKAKTSGFYLRTGAEKPPRSVCVACFANGLAHYEDMHDNRPEEWETACQVDDAIRDMSSIGVREPVFVSDTLIPLRELPALDFLRGTKQEKEHKCNKGVCYV